MSEKKMPQPQSLASALLNSKLKSIKIRSTISGQLSLSYGTKSVVVPGASLPPRTLDLLALANIEEWRKSASLKKAIAAGMVVLVEVA